MDSVPRFVFPIAPQDHRGLDAGGPGLGTEKPTISLHTDDREAHAYSLLVSKTRPEPMRTVSTPPDSPTRLRAYTAGPQSPAFHSSGVMTPPPTPTKISHGRSSSGFTLGESFESLRRGGSVSSKTGRASIDVDESERPGSIQALRFPYWSIDYNIPADHKGRRTPIGSGYWSDVYLATPSLPTSSAPIAIPAAELSPPVTPVHSRNSSLARDGVPSIPASYAVKTPAMNAAKKVLAEEGRILSYLSRFPGAEKYVVTFYGQDSRTDALVLKLMDDTLESWTQKSLNSLTEQHRATKLAAIFPSIAATLLDGLHWLQENNCTHADIKPANILVSSTPSQAPHPVYTDFSSALLPALHNAQPDAAGKPKAPLGGGTWDFLDPTLLTKATASTPASAQSDLWGLAVTLLVLVLGVSPFDCANANQYQRREMIKLGDPLASAAYGDDGPRNVARLAALSKALGFDVRKWFAAVLVKDAGKRVGVREWGAMFESAGKRSAPRI